MLYDGRHWGPKVSSHTAEALERNIENELKENVGMPGWDGDSMW